MLSLKKYFYYRKFCSRLHNLESLLKVDRTFPYFVSERFDFNSIAGAYLIRHRIYTVLNTVIDLKQKSHELMECTFSFQNGFFQPTIIAKAEEFLVSEDLRFDVNKYATFIQSLLKYQQLTLIDFHFSFDALKCVCIQKIERSFECLITGDFSNDEAIITRAVATIEEISCCDLGEFLARICPIEQLLISEPANIYRFMCSNSKIRYRQALQNLSNKTNKPIERMVKQLLEVCKENLQHDNLRHHIGFHIFKSCQVNKKALSLIGVYELIVLILGLIMTYTLLSLNIKNIILAVCFSMPILLLSMELIDGIALSTIILLIRKREIFSMQAEYYNSKKNKIVVAIPCIIDGEESIERIVSSLRKNSALALEENVVFVILPDWVDSKYEESNDNEIFLLQTLICRVQNENMNFGGDKFFILHRARQYSKSQKIWYGRERKSGKIQDLLKLINGRENNFAYSLGNLSKLSASEFLVVLDEDSLLVEGALQRMISAMLHPLNRAAVESNSKFISSGYGIMAPTLFINPESVREGWLRQFLFTRPVINEQLLRQDFCTSRVSTYDAFSEIAFVGKGAYRVSQAMDLVVDKLPKERVLSHDIIEGGILRTGYTNDAAIIENFPNSYESFCLRMHRWIRGDWQNFLLLIFNSWTNLPSSKFSRYLILGNARRAIIPVVTGMIVCMALYYSPHNSLTLVIAAIFIHLIIDYVYLSGLICKSIYQASFLVSVPTFSLYFVHVHLREVIKLYLKPHYGLVAADAVMLATWRFFTKNKSLEWHPSGSNKPFPKIILAEPKIISLIAAGLAVQTLYTHNLYFLISLFWLPFPILVRKLY